MIYWTCQTRRRLLYPNGDQTLEQAPPWLPHDLFTAQSANPLCCSAGTKSHQVTKSFGTERARRVVPSGAAAHCSPVPGQQQTGHRRPPALLQLSLCWHPAPYSRRELVPKKTHHSAVCWQLVLSITAEMFEKHPCFCSLECWQQSRESRGASHGE